MLAPKKTVKKYVAILHQPKLLFKIISWRYKEQKKQLFFTDSDASIKNSLREIIRQQAGAVITL